VLGLSELAILLIIILLVLGAKKLPELARNAGKAARILKSEAKAMKTQSSVDIPHPPADHIIQGQSVGGADAQRRNGESGDTVPRV
jgi:sec-independent protein translocase protein TatA